MFSTTFLMRSMSRGSSRGPKQWEPPSKQIYELRTPEKRPMGLPIDFRKPRTPGRVSLGDRNRVMRFQNWGCKNRPFLRIIVSIDRLPLTRKDHFEIEQLGTYDPIVNAHGEKLVSLNIERICYYLALGIRLEAPVAQLLGLAGLLPQSPTTYVTALRNRRELMRGYT